MRMASSAVNGSRIAEFVYTVTWSNSVKEEQLNNNQQQ